MHRRAPPESRGRQRRQSDRLVSLVSLFSLIFVSSLVFLSFPVRVRLEGLFSLRLSSESLNQFTPCLVIFPNQFPSIFNE